MKVYSLVYVLLHSLPAPTELPYAVHYVLPRLGRKRLHRSQGLVCFSQVSHMDGSEESPIVTMVPILLARACCISCGPSGRLFVVLHAKC